MEINADFSKPAVVRPGDVDWQPSPLPGVERRMLDRIGGEVARATTIVRFAPNSRFDRHDHALGEEYIVLDGVFSDEDGHFPVGSYVRNPPGTSHAPWSDDGCTIFVKLRQFDPNDLQPVTVNLNDIGGAMPLADGVRARELHRFGSEIVRVLYLEEGGTIEEEWAKGGEFLILSGSLEIGDELYPQGTWLRFPPGSSIDVKAIGKAVIWNKTGHL